MNSCYQQFCQNFKEPTFVSIQSGLYSYHYGPEVRYLMKLNGCDVKHIETQNGQAEYMTVAIDQSTFDQNTNYYELSLLRPHQIVKTFFYQNNFSLVLLQKF